MNVEQIPHSHNLYSKLTEVIEQVPKDVLYGFCCFNNDTRFLFSLKIRNI